MRSVSYRFLKRSIDILGTVLLALFFLPLAAIIGFLIKLTSNGPILYSHIVIGKDEKPFRLYKFRTMYANNDNSRHRQATEEILIWNKPSGYDDAGLPLYKIREDNRITPVGRYLRRLSLDEIPQFINVLKGEMSLVGPRPSITYEYELYRDDYKERLKVLPGITGPYQVMKRYRANFEEMVAIDLEYIRHPSLMTDLKILVKTPVAMLKGL